MKEYIVDSVRGSGDLAGVFEFEGKVGYFYLYKVSENKILGAIHIFSGDHNLSEDDIAVKWDTSEEKVGIVIKGVLWAVFNTINNSKFGGDYKEDGLPNIPKEEVF